MDVVDPVTSMMTATRGINARADNSPSFLVSPRNPPSLSRSLWYYWCNYCTMDINFFRVEGRSVHACTATAREEKKLSLFCFFVSKKSQHIDSRSGLPIIPPRVPQMVDSRLSPTSSFCKDERVVEV